MANRSKAIVLSRTVFGEADLYVQFLTQAWGVVTTLAKAARKSKRRYVGGLDLFCHNEILVRGKPKERPYLSELVVLNSFSLLRENFDKMMVAGKVLQWIKKLSDVSEPIPQVYSLVGQTLALIEKEENPTRLESLSLFFKLKLLTQLGLKPQVSACVKCGEALHPPTFFNTAAGGGVCQNCQKTSGESISLESEDQYVLAFLEQLKMGQWAEAQFPQRRIKPLHSLITHFASFHTHTRLSA